MPDVLTERLVKKFDPELEARKMKPTFRLGPIQFDIEDTADMLTMLATKLAESLIDRKIIPATATKLELDQIDRLQTSEADTRGLSITKG